MDDEAHDLGGRNKKKKNYSRIYKYLYTLYTAKTRWVKTLQASID